MNPTLQLIRRTGCLACPNCGYRPLFRGLFRMHLECPECGLPLARRQGFYLGAMAINYGIIVFGLMPVLLIAFFNQWISLKWGMILAFGVAVVGPMLAYRISWGLWLFTYYVFLPKELPCNCGEKLFKNEHINEDIEN